MDYKKSWGWPYRSFRRDDFRKVLSRRRSLHATFQLTQKPIDRTIRVSIAIEIDRPATGKPDVPNSILEAPETIDRSLEAAGTGAGRGADGGRHARNRNHDFSCRKRVSIYLHFL